MSINRSLGAIQAARRATKHRQDRRHVERACRWTMPGDPDGRRGRCKRRLTKTSAPNTLPLVKVSQFVIAPLLDEKLTAHDVSRSQRERKVARLADAEVVVCRRPEGRFVHELQIPGFRLDEDDEYEVDRVTVRVDGLEDPIHVGPPDDVWRADMNSEVVRRVKLSDEPELVDRDSHR
jgi:hypothetical protein